MSDVRSRANALNPSFPTPGVNNSSQGFRDNTAATQQALFTAGDEITNLQTTRIQISGDVLGSSDRIVNATSQSGTDPLLNLTVNLATLLSNPGLLDTRTQDFQLTLDSKGRVASLKNVQYGQVLATGHQAGQAITTQVTNLGVGSGTIQIPGFVFDTQGRLQGTTTSQVSYGLQGHALNQGSMIVGGQGNLSTTLSSPLDSSTYTLQVSRGQLSWQIVGGGTVTGVLGGSGVQVTANSTSPQVSLALGSLATLPNTQDADRLAVYDVSEGTNASVTIGALRALSRLTSDPAPVLAGPLETSGQWIQGSTGVRLRSAPQNPQATLQITETALLLQGSAASPLTLNGALWPLAAGQAGQGLTMGSGGMLQWTTAPVLYTNVTGTVFVSPQGSDTLGTGAINNPLLTVTRALQTIPQNSTASWTIMLLGGTYGENITIQNIQDIRIQNFSTARATLTGKMSVLGGVNRLELSNLALDNTANPVADLQPALNITSGLQSARFRDCRFIRGPLNGDLPIMSLAGQVVQDVRFETCEIEGQIVQNFQAQGSSRVVFHDCRSSATGWVNVQVVQGTNTLLRGEMTIRGLRHLGGVLDIQDNHVIQQFTQTITTTNASLPQWLAGSPVFITSGGQPVQYLDAQGQPGTTYLLDAQGARIPVLNSNPVSYQTTTYVQATVAVPPTVTQVSTGLYSTASGTGDQLNLLNVTLLDTLGNVAGLLKTGTCSWRAQGSRFNPGSTGPLGTRLQPQGGRPVTQVPTGNHVVTLGDENATLIMRDSQAVQVTLGDTLVSNIAIGSQITVIQGGAGTVEIVGQDIRTSTGRFTRRPNSVVTLTQTDQNVWVLGGDLDPLRPMTRIDDTKVTLDSTVPLSSG